MLRCGNEADEALYGVWQVTETSSIQSRGLESGSLIVGRIRPPMAMWPALEGIASTTAVRNGVLIIFNQNVRGRIGVFCNRYISGAVIESTGESGLDAVRLLFGIKGGMFGFRAAIGDEWSEVGKQSLGLDLHELLIHRNPDEGPETAVRALMMPGSQLVRGSDLPMYGEDDGLMGESLMGDGGLMGGDLSAPTDYDSDKTFEPVEAKLESTSDSSFSYLDWFADQMGQPNELPKFAQILMTASPAAMPANLDAQPSEKVFIAPAGDESVEIQAQSYGRLLMSEREKVIRDIELSMERGRTADGGNDMDDAVSDLQLLSDFMEAEQQRAQKWVGLDEIPTPKVDVGQSGARITSESLKTSSRMRAVNFEETGDKQQDMDKLLATSARHSLPKDFVNPVAPPTVSSAGIRHLDVEVHWWQLPAVMGIMSVLAIGGIVIAISSYQSAASYEATLTDARHGLRENPAAAANVLSKAIQGQPGNPRGYLYRGIAYGAAGEYDKAVQDLDNSFMKGEDFKLVELSKAAAACRAAKYVEAIASCDAVLRRDAGNQQAKTLKELSEQLQKAAEPINVMPAATEDTKKKEEQTAQTQPKKPIPLDKSVIADALPSAQPKLPSDPHKLIAMGYDYLREGDRSSAVAVFSEAVKRAPNNAEARRYLAHTLAEQGHDDAASSQFSALTSLGGLSPRDALTYAEVLERTSKEADARDLLAHFVETNPNDLNIRVELVRLYSDANMKAQADALYQSSLPFATTGEARRALDDAHAGSEGETIHIRR